MRVAELAVGQTGVGVYRVTRRLIGPATSTLKMDSIQYFVQLTKNVAAFKLAILTEVFPRSMQLKVGVRFRYWDRCLPNLVSILLLRNE